MRAPGEIRRLEEIGRLPDAACRNREAIVGRRTRMTSAPSTPTSCARGAGGGGGNHDALPLHHAGRTPATSLAPAHAAPCSWSQHHPLAGRALDGMHVLVVNLGSPRAHRGGAANLPAFHSRTAAAALATATRVSHCPVCCAENGFPEENRVTLSRFRPWSDYEFARLLFEAPRPTRSNRERGAPLHGSLRIGG